MIELKFKGGLGNQMFQYALYIQLKKIYKHTNIQFKFDTDSYLCEKFHNGFDLTKAFNLHNIKSNITPMSGIWYIYYKLKVNIKKYIYPYLPWIICIKDFQINKEQLFYLHPNKHYFLTGTWYSDKYFSDVYEEVKSSFQFDNHLSDDNRKLLIDIENSESISMHVRRGDFITKNVEKSPLSESDFYERAVNLIYSSIANMGGGKIFVFSDEPDWCMTNMKFLQNYQHVFVTNNQGSESFRDMQLMSKCKYNIIANSSFSWWGAFLNSTPNKIVICPAILDKDGKQRDDIHKQIYCDEWLKI